MRAWISSLFPLAPWQIAGVRYWLYAAAGLSALSIVYSAIGLWPLRRADALVLHYTPVFGIDRIGPWEHAFFPALLAIVVLVINSLLVSALANRHRGFLPTLGVFTVALEAGCFAAAIVVVSLNR